MNTEGLFFDGTRTPNAPYPANDNKQDCGCYIWTKILQECKTTEEAIAYARKYRIPEIEDIHVLFADKGGNSAIIGVYKKELQIHCRTGNYQLLTNFNMASPPYGGEPVCNRYAAADSMLRIDSSATVGNVQKILAQTSQDEQTIYSNIYNLTTGGVYEYSLHGRNGFNSKTRFNLSRELKKEGVP